MHNSTEGRVESNPSSSELQAVFSSQNDSDVEFEENRVFDERGLEPLFGFDWLREEAAYTALGEAQRLKTLLEQEFAGYDELSQARQEYTTWARSGQLLCQLAATLHRSEGQEVPIRTYAFPERFLAAIEQCGYNRSDIAEAKREMMSKPKYPTWEREGYHQRKLLMFLANRYPGHSSGWTIAWAKFYFNRNRPLHSMSEEELLKSWRKARRARSMSRIQFMFGMVERNAGRDYDLGLRESDWFYDRKVEATGYYIHVDNYRPSREMVKAASDKLGLDILAVYTALESMRDQCNTGLKYRDVSMHERAMSRYLYRQARIIQTEQFTAGVKTNSLHSRVRDPRDCRSEGRDEMLCNMHYQVEPAELPPILDAEGVTEGVWARVLVAEDDAQREELEKFSSDIAAQRAQYEQSEGIVRYERDSLVGFFNDSEQLFAEMKFRRDVAYSLAYHCQKDWFIVDSPPEEVAERSIDMLLRYSGEQATDNELDELTSLMNAPLFHEIVRAVDARSK